MKRLIYIIVLLSLTLTSYSNNGLQRKPRSDKGGHHNYPSHRK